MWPIFRQRPAKMANSPLSEINGLYINAAMGLHDDGWSLFEPGGASSSLQRAAMASNNFTVFSYRHAMAPSEDFFELLLKNSGTTVTRNQLTETNVACINNLAACVPSQLKFEFSKLPGPREALENAKRALTRDMLGRPSDISEDVWATYSLEDKKDIVGVTIAFVSPLVRFRWL